MLPEQKDSLFLLYLLVVWVNPGNSIISKVNLKANEASINIKACCAYSATSYFPFLTEGLVTKVGSKQMIKYLN